MHIAGIHLERPTSLGIAVMVVLCSVIIEVFVGATGASSSSFSGAGAMCAGVIGSIFGVQAQKSILHLVAIGVLGIAGAVVGLALFVLH